MKNRFLIIGFSLLVSLGGLFHVHASYDSQEKQVEKRNCVGACKKTQKMPHFD